MKLLIGECLGIEERTAGQEPNTWVERSIVVLDGTNVDKAVMVRDFKGAAPTKGEQVCIEVGVRAYSTRSGGAGYGFSAFGRSKVAEDALFHATAKS